MNQKNIFHLHPNQNFWECEVNGKQPKSHITPITIIQNCMKNKQKHLLPEVSNGQVFYCE